MWRYPMGRYLRLAERERFLCSNKKHSMETTHFRSEGRRSARFSSFSSNSSPNAFLRRCGALILAAALGAAIPSASAVEARTANAKLIVPGKAVGKTKLGHDGLNYLKNLPKPDASDPGMSQNRLIWLSGKAPEAETLFIHTVANSVIAAKPANGMTIDEIRVSSADFRTPEGVQCGNTLAQIRKAYPDIQPSEDSNGRVFQDAARGIAFEFLQAPREDTPCIAITVFAPNEARITSRDQVASLLNDHP